MDGGYIFLVAVTFGTMLIIAQRLTPGVKRLTRGFIVTMALIMIFWVYPERQSASITGFILALVISFLFWVLIGRYNPVEEREEIKVYGLDD